MRISWAQLPKIDFFRGKLSLDCVPSSFEIFLIFPYFLRSWVLSSLAIRVTLDARFRFICSEWKLYYKFVKSPNNMSRIVGWAKIILKTTAARILLEMVNLENSDIHGYQFFSCKYKVSSDSYLVCLIFACTKIFKNQWQPCLPDFGIELKTVLETRATLIFGGI